MAEYIFTINGKDYKVNVKNIEKNIADIELNGKNFKVNIKQIGEILEKKHIKKTIKKPTVKKESTGIKKITAPLPGVILNINVREGDTITQGQDVLIMEAMKMENTIQSAYSGKVLKIFVSKEDTVQEGDVLIEIGN